MRQSLLWLTGLAALGAILLGSLAGCTTVGGPVGGGDITITGSIVDAANPTAPIDDAYVYVPVSDPGAEAAARADVYASDRSGASGAYELTRIPAGERTLVVEGPAGGAFAGLAVTLDLVAGSTVNIQVTLTPSALASTPAGVVVTPDNQTVLPGRTRQFAATVYATGGGTVDLTPTWIVQDGIGSVDGTGLFTACGADQLDGATPRAGKVVAVVADKLGDANVTVAPQLLVGYSGASDPNELDFGELRSEWTGQVAFGVLAGLTPDEIAAATWNAASDATWLSVDPATGGSAGPTDVTVKIDRSALAEGNHTGHIKYASAYGEFETTVSAGVLRDGSKIGYLGYDQLLGYLDDAGALHENGGTGIAFAFSPDGTEAATPSWTGTGCTEVQAVNLENGATRTVAALADLFPGASPAGEFPNAWVDWSPTGDFAVAVDTGTQILLRLASSAGVPTGTVATVGNHTNDEWGVTALWSPDGSRVVSGFTRSVTGDVRLAFYDVSGGAATLSTVRVVHGAPDSCWTADGSRLLLRDETGIVSLDPLTGTTARALTWDSVLWVAASPAGDRVAFCAPGPGGSYSIMRIWVADSNFANPRIAHEGRTAGIIDWWAPVN